VSGETVLVRCPAKINLRLEVLGRRPDGYHELRTLFQAIDLEDHLEIGPAEGLILATDDPRLPVGEENLVMRAARALAAAFDVGKPGARMRLRKAIPLEGGLGGGSSDAAGALAGLSRVWGISASPEVLAALAATLGSDVPFFLSGGTAYGGGRGERIVPLPSLAPTSVLLGIPPYGVSTAEVYGRLGGLVPLTPQEGGVTVPALFHKLVAEKDFGLVANDLERAVLAGWPELASFREALVATGARAAAVSGSGSTVFGLYDGAAPSGRKWEALEGRFPGWKFVATRTVPHGVRVEASRGGGAQERRG
jgi:4-diphosphocytidyl-2-C-methyl-D-erythritol kinase